MRIPLLSPIIIYHPLIVLSDQELEAISGFTQSLFNSIFVHRVKDFHDEVRVTALAHLIDFVRFEPSPKKPLRVEYLKYLGWACSDFCSQVRMDAITSIQELVEVRYIT